jgi:UDP:flavonoid glycosyltransferase YjiC (YdhE family)
LKSRVPRTRDAFSDSKAGSRCVSDLLDVDVVKRRIVITSWGSYGDVFPYIGIAKALAQRGHRPVLATQEFYRATIEHEGLEFSPVGPDVDPNDQATVARIMDPRRGTEVILRDLLMPALRHSYQQLKEAARGADLLVSHPVTFAAPVLAEEVGLPWVSTVLAPISFFSTTDLPAFPPAPRLVHLRRLGPWFGRLMVGLARRVTRGWMEPVYALRRDLGLARGGDPIYEGQFSPALTLALFSRLLAAPQPDWPSNVRTTGFVLYNGSDTTLDSQVEAFLGEGPPPVVFTLGTSAVANAGRFYHESVEAARRLGLRAILLTGGFSENKPDLQLSRDILAADRAPHQLLFPRAAAIVHQGGIGTTGQALRAGHPMLVVPHAHDQPDNAFRVGNLGLSRTVFPGGYKAARVARELERLLIDPRYEQRAKQVASVVGVEGGAETAADALAPLVEGRADVTSVAVGST